MENEIQQAQGNEMDIVIKYADEAGKTLILFSEQVMTDSKENYEVLRNLDTQDNKMIHRHVK